NAVLAFSERVGWKVPYGGDLELPISVRYFAGGSTTLRGFGFDEAGPTAQIAGVTVPGGGQMLTILNTEYRFPLAMPDNAGNRRLGAVLFYDTGNVFERPRDFSLKQFTNTLGAGLRFRTPLGPIRFDVGFNLNPQIQFNDDGTLTRNSVIH